MDTIWEAFTKEEYQQSLPSWINHDKSSSEDIEGFDFFCSVEAYDEQDEMIVLVLIHHEKLIAALSLEIIATNVYEINHLEVHRSYRGQGLSVKMYEILDEWVLEDTIIIGSDMTLEGHQSNLRQKRNEILTHCKTFNYRRDYLKTLE
ncbi:GNAT family N-acetyltransferase [Microbacteriaceae bacterium 4G12]